MRKILAAGMLLLLAAAAYAGGETAADVLKSNPSVRSLSLGGAGIASIEGATAALINPSALALMKNRQLAYMHSFGNFSIRTETVNYAQAVDLPFMTGAAGASFIYRHMDAIDNPDATGGPVDIYDYVMAASAGFGLAQYFPGTFADKLLAGISVKLVQQTIGQYSGASVCGDLGLTLNMHESGFRAALTASNAGMPLKFISESSPLPLTFGLGFSYDFEADKDNMMAVMMSVNYDIYDYPRISAGFEDRMLGIFFIRAGYDQPVDTRSPAYASLGTGVSVTQFDVTVTIDYSYRPELWNGLNGVTASHFLQAMVSL